MAALEISSSPMAGLGRPSATRCSTKSRGPLCLPNGFTRTLWKISSNFFSPFHSVQPHRPTTNPNTSKFAQKYGGAEKCSRCGDSVYAAEKIIGAGKVKDSGGELSASPLNLPQPSQACVL